MSYRVMPQYYEGVLIYNVLSYREIKCLISKERLVIIYHFSTLLKVETK